MRSVDVVFPASICAMMPILRVCSSCVLCSIEFFYAFLPASGLPAVMCERFVRFSHAVNVFLALDGAAAPIRRVQKLVRQLVGHGFPGTRARVQQKPANGQRLPAKLADLNRNLVVRAADPPGLHLQHRLDVFHRLLENLERLVVGLLSHLLHRSIENALSGGLFAVPHHRVDELLNQVAAVNRIRQNRTARYESLTWHLASPFSYLLCAAFGRLAPYLERPCLRLSTPAASSVPRMM